MPTHYSLGCTSLRGKNANETGCLPAFPAILRAGISFKALFLQEKQVPFSCATLKRQDFGAGGQSSTPGEGGYF